MTRRPCPTSPTNRPLATTGVIRTAGTAALLTGLLWGCRSPESANFDTIEPGMSTGDVIDRLGQPSSRMNAPEDGANTAWASRWHWGDTLGTLATHATMPDQPPPANVWTVWFDSDGAVLAATPPSRTHNTAETAPWEPPPLPNR